MGHVPFNLAPLISAFLGRDTNSGFAKVVGEKVNRGAGYGLEIPCVYTLHGPKPHIEKLKELVASKDWPRRRVLVCMKIFRSISRTIIIKFIVCS